MVWRALLVSAKQARLILILRSSRMDLYDVTAYFTFYVPRLAATRPLLRSACCALASKHIRRLLESRGSGLDARLPYLGSDFWRRNLTTRNWNYESAAYYDDAIRLLMDEITRLTSLSETSSNRRHRSEEALAAIAILCVYELLDAPGPEWSAHMSALPLLETAPAQILDTLSPQPLPRGSSKRSIFWNFVRQDYLYACKEVGRTFGRSVLLMNDSYSRHSNSTQPGRPPTMA